jgi:signal transduction histidine kinase
MAIGGIAHEIRNPLGVSSAAAQLMRRCAGSPERIEECIGKVIGGIDRASLVVESLLRFALPGPLRETARVDVVEVLTNALNFASGELPARTTVRWKLPSQVRPAYVQGAQNLLEMVIINLMLNAFQAMPKGGRMSIDLRFDGPEIVIEIGDTGPGISPEHVSRIFDPFFTTGGDQRRSGLGLSVSHSIVRQHGGNLTVRTAPCEGTTFTVRLPAAPAALKAVEQLSRQTLPDRSGRRDDGAASRRRGSTSGVATL